MRRILPLAFALLLALPAAAQDEVADMQEREGWRVIRTDMSYEDLLARMEEAIAANRMGLVTNAGPTGVARNRGVDIPGNRVLGVFNNVIAVRTLRISTAAMIEAPIRFYVTENQDGTATLSWKEPSTVFAPYIEEAGRELGEIAAELDQKFEAIAEDATQ
ncbi:MAG: DUF302 domain-containing protein [Pseudomonadota bacterium]